MFNPTQHSYFNLAGHQSGKVLKQQLQVLANTYTPADDNGIPTGELCPVKGSVFDLNHLKPIGDYLSEGEKEFKITSGLDHNWCLTQRSEALPVATVYDPESGRKLEVCTTMPGMQVYTANFLPRGLKGKNGAEYAPYHAFCLETQFYPDAPNQPHFPSATLLADQPFYSLTEYRLSQ